MAASSEPAPTKYFMSLSKLQESVQVAKTQQLFTIPTQVKTYNALVLLHLDYCCVLWHSCGSVLTKKVEQIQTLVMTIITSFSRYTPSETLEIK